MTPDAKYLKGLWRWYNKNKKDIEARRVDPYPHYFGSLKDFLRGEAYHHSYSNRGLSCRFYLRRKGNNPDIRGRIPPFIYTIKMPEDY